MKTGVQWAFYCRCGNEKALALGQPKAIPDAMFATIKTQGYPVLYGAIAAMQALAARGLDPNLPAMKAHGVPWLIRHFRGEIGMEEAVEGAKRDTRQYTKRQATWFRNQLPEFVWVEPDKALAAVEEQLRGLAN